MRKIIVTEFYSLNGIMSDPKDQMDWVTATFSKDMGKYEDDLYDSADTLMLGRVTYKIFESYWPSPNVQKEDAAMAIKINNAQKIVFSKTLKELTWQKSVLKTEIDPNEIAGLKKQKGKNIIIVGSATIVQQMISLHLIDELHVLVHPVILASGKSLFENVKDRHTFKLLDATTFQNGVVLLRYKPSDEDKK